MKNRLKQWTQLLLLGSLLLLGQLAQAEMYKWVDEEGNVSYSDQPQHKDARKLDSFGDNTIPATPVPPRAQPAPTAPDEPETRYSSLQITSPEHDQAIRSNPGNITVSLAIEPALNVAQGHSISLLLDQQLVSENITTDQSTLQNIDRGTHQLSAVIKNKQGRTLKQSDSITFHLHRHSILHPNAGQN
jgi:hypothetical protein